MPTYGTVYGAGVNKHSFWDSLVLRRQSQYFSTMMPAIKIAKHTRQNTASRLSTFIPPFYLMAGRASRRFVIPAERPLVMRNNLSASSK